MTGKQFANVAWSISAVCLYGTGHWIGGTIALVIFLLI